MHFVDRHGWPVERIKGRPILNFIRLLIHTRRIRRGRFAHRMPAPDPTTTTEKETGE